MEDVQKQRDNRNIAIDRVGIRRISHPIIVLDKSRGRQSTVAEIDMSVDLSEESRATHMSRFVEVLEALKGEVNYKTISRILNKIKNKLGASKAEIAFDFPYFIEKTAPVSGMKSLMQYDCRFLGTLDGDYDFVLSVTVPVTTLCPCSKAISVKSAHNQRTLLTVSIRFSEFVWLEDLIRIAEESASAEVFSLLKRCDEKFVTEQAYARPRFAEDLVRETARKLDSISEIVWYAISAESLESIHAHSAYAFIKRDKRPQPTDKISKRSNRRT